MSKFWERAGDMFLTGIQVLFQTIWGLLWAAISGGIPAMAAAASNVSKYNDAYWMDVLPVFIAGALVGIGAYAARQRALYSDPPTGKDKV